jgi:hypothetical protein
MGKGLKPIAAVGEPPTCVADGDRRGERPPEWKHHIGNQAEDRERDPEYFALHMPILDASALVMLRRYSKMFQIQMPAGTAVARMPQRSRHDA